MTPVPAGLVARGGFRDLYACDGCGRAVYRVHLDEQFRCIECATGQLSIFDVPGVAGCARRAGA